MGQYMVRVHHAGGFIRHIFSDSQYPKLQKVNVTCSHSGCGDLIVSEGVKYVTSMCFLSSDCNRIYQIL